MEFTVHDNREAKRGRVQLELQFGKKGEKNQWFVQEVLDGDGWEHVGFAKPSKGTFDVKDWGVIWLWDQDPGQSKPRNTVILHDAPKDDGDYKKTEGHGRIYDPSDTAFKDCRIRWKTPGLTPVRKKVLAIIEKTFPAYPGNLPIPNAIDSSTSYGSTGLGKVTNCGVLPGWIARQLGYYLPWEDADKLKKFTQNVLKKDATDLYLHKIPDAEAFKLDKGDKSKSTFASPLAGGWGHYPGPKISSYPLLLEKVRNLPAGTIWIPYYAGRENKDERPKPGDIYVLMQDLAGHFAHVGIIIDSIGSVWRTADCGQSGKNAAAYKKRNFDKNVGTLILDPPETNTPDGGIRYLEGWVNIDKLYEGWKP